MLEWVYGEFVLVGKVLDENKIVPTVYNFSELRSENKKSLNKHFVIIAEFEVLLSANVYVNQILKS